MGSAVSMVSVVSMVSKVVMVKLIDYNARGPPRSATRLHTTLHCASRCPESLLHLMQMHSRCTDPHLH